MSRSIAGAIIALMLGSVVPAAAGEPQSLGPALDASIAAAALAPLAGDIDWSMPAVHIGAPKRGGLLPALYTSLAALNVYDAYSTSTALSAGARELNPLMKPIAANRAVLWAVKGGVTASSIVLAEGLWRSHHRVAAISSMVISNGVMAIVAAQNARVLGGQR
jgi:hypothetical protein